MSTSKSGSIRAAVIGLGIGKFHLAGWLGLASEGVELAAVCDLDPTKIDVAAQAFAAVGKPLPPREGFYYTSYQEMFEKADLDAVSIAVPNFLHKEVAVAAFDTGVNVLLEKPLANTLADGNDIVAAWKKSGKQGVANLNNNYTPTFKIVDDLNRQGKLGKLQTVRGWWNRRNGIPFWGMWFTNKARSGGGPGIDLMPHLLGWTLGLQDWPQPEWVSGAAFSDGGDAPGFGPYAGGLRNPNGIYDVERRLSVYSRLSNGVMLEVDAAWAMHTDLERMGFEVIGSQGTVKVERVWPNNDGDDATAVDTITLYSTEIIGGMPVATNTSINPDNDPTSRDPFMGRTHTQPELLRCIRTGSRPRTDLNHLLMIQKVIDAAYRSSDDGSKPVSP